MHAVRSYAGSVPLLIVGLVSSRCCCRSCCCPSRCATLPGRHGSPSGARVGGQPQHRWVPDRGRRRGESPRPSPHSGCRLRCRPPPGRCSLGALLGLIGLSLSEWETRAGHLYFTPNRWLVGALTLLVVARLAYGAWRMWDAWLAWGGQSGWLSSSSAAGSLAAGALLIGYGLGFWSAVRWRIARRKAALLMQI